MNQLPHINTSQPSQPIHSQQRSQNLLLQRQQNSQGQVFGMEQANYQTQMQNLQQQQQIQQMSPYPNNSPLIQNLSSSTSSSSTVPQRLVNQNIQYKQTPSQANINSQAQLQSQSEGYIHHHTLQNQQVQQMQQQPNQMNQQPGGIGPGVPMAHGQQFNHQMSQQPQQQQQQQQVQNQGQINYQLNQNQQQGMTYSHQGTGVKQHQQIQPAQQQHPQQGIQQQQPQQQQYPQQQDSRRNSSRSDKNSSQLQLNGAPLSQPQQSSLVFVNQVGICSEKDGPFSILEQFVEPIYEDFVYLTEKILDKTMKSANKQLQDTLMNYFLENHVSNLIIKEMNCISKRAVRYEIEKTMQKNKTAKYMNLLNAFEAKVKQFSKEKAYENLLMQLITDENSGSRQSEQWKTLVRKRILALLLFVHWRTPNAETTFNDFFAIWDLIYPNHPLPQKVKKSAVVGGGSGSGSQVSSQLAFSNQGQQAEKPVNPNKTMKRNKQKIIDSMNLSQQSLSSQVSNLNSQSTSLFQNSYGSNSQQRSKEPKTGSSQTTELHRSSVKSEIDVPTNYEINQYNQNGQYQQQSGIVYQNQRNQMYIPPNQQQNQDIQLPLQSSSSAFYPSQGSQQQYDYTQNYYGSQQGNSPNYDQNYLAPPQQLQQPQTGIRPSSQVLKGRMRSQSWDDPGYKREEYNSPQNPQNNNLLNQQQLGYFNQSQAPQSQFYQQNNQQYSYDQAGEYYDPNLTTQQYSHPSLSHQSSSGYYVDYQSGSSQQHQQQQIINRNPSNSLPQNINDPNQQQMTNSYGYGNNQHYQNQQYQNQNYPNNQYNSQQQQQYQQVQKIPFYQNNMIYDIQEVKQEGTPSSQNTQESNNNQFFHMDKIVLPDPESPEQRLKRGSQQNPQNNYTPLNSNSRPRYSLQYNQVQQNQQEIMQFNQQQQQNKNVPSQQQQQYPQNLNNSGQKSQYDQSGNKYQQIPINNTKQEEDLYSSSSQQYNGSNTTHQQQQQSRPQKQSKSNSKYDSANNSDSGQQMKNKNGIYIMAKQEEIETNPQDQPNDINKDFNANEIDQTEYKEKKRNTLQNPPQIQQQVSSKPKDKRMSSPNVMSQVQVNDNKLQNIQLHPTPQSQENQQGNLKTSDGSLNKNQAQNNQEKLAQNIYNSDTINEDEKDNDISRSSNNVNVSSDQYYQSQSEQGEIPPSSSNKSSNSKGQGSKSENINANPVAQYVDTNKESTQVNNGLFQDYQNSEDQYLNLPGQNGTNTMIMSNDDKFIRNSQRQNTGASCMSIESEKTPFKRSDTRNMTGLSNISIESDKDGRTPTYINRSKFFFRHQNSLEFPPVIGVRSNVRQGTAISNISDGQGAAEMLGSQTNIHQFFQKRSNFKQFSGISHISIEGGEFNYLQMMQTSNQSQNFINRSQLRKRTNLSVDSLASFNIKPDKDIQNLSFDLENLSLHNQQLDNNNNTQILPQDTVNETNNILDDKQTSTIFQQYYSPTNEILP